MLGQMKVAVVIVLVAACGGGDPEPADAPASAPAAGTPGTTMPVSPDVELPEGVTQEMVAAGKTIFETTTCWTCHGMDATGGPLAPNLRDGEWLNTDGSYDGIMQIVRTGVPEPVEHPGLMPPMGGGQLTDEQIRQVAAYVYAIGHGG